ncbi:MAG: hypothetical protein CMK43_01400, partial [Porticoccaceae bacterium]|nr:hypothetical protein [Porticoccaceae bacterium]
RVSRSLISLSILTRSTISPSEFDIYFNSAAELEEGKHVLFNFTDHGQTIKSFRVKIGGDHDEFIENDNEFGWDMFDSMMCLVVGPLHEQNYKKVLPANIARLYVWRFWDDAREKLKRPKRRKVVPKPSKHSVAGLPDQALKPK